MTTEATTRAEALAELAAIRAAAPLYVASPEAEARAAARAAKEQAAKQQAAYRATLPARAIEYVPAPVHVPTEAELAEAEAARRRAASIARALYTAELAEARQARARQARRAAVAGNAENMFAELCESPAELEKAARKARATGKLRAAQQRADLLAELGMTEAEARAMELLEADTEQVAGWAAPGAVPSKRAKTEAGMPSALSPAELAAVAEWTRAGLASPAARAGRAALEAIGPVASAMVRTNRKARKVTVEHVLRAPKVEAAEARASKAEAALEAARARLAEAEAAAAAAEATGAVPVIRKAEAEANRVADIVRKAAARAEQAAARLAEANRLAGLPVMDGWTSTPVESFKLAEAGRAAELALPARADRMPARFREQGPQAKGQRYFTDNTPKLALAELDRLTEAEQARYWAETWDMITELIEAKRAAEQAEAEARAEASKAARKAYKAAHERDRRARARKGK